MPYILYQPQHGAVARFDGPAWCATPGPEEIVIPCEPDADLADSDRWHAQAAIMQETGAPAPTVALAREIAVSALREKRKAMEYGGFLLNGQRWDSEEKDELRLNSAIKMLELTGMQEFPGWKVAEDVYIRATPAILKAAALALLQHYSACFAVEAAKNAELAALESPQAVAAWLESDLNTGWPGE